MTRVPGWLRDGVGVLLGLILAAVVIAVVLALLATYNVASFAHPLWFLPVAIAIFVAAGWAGAQMTPRDRWPGRRVR